MSYYILTTKLHKMYETNGGSAVKKVIINRTV